MKQGFFCYSHDPGELAGRHIYLFIHLNFLSFSKLHLTIGLPYSICLALSIRKVL